MKVNRLAAAILAALFACAFVLAACTPSGAKPIPPAQVMAIACPPTLAAITQFQALNATLPDDPQAVKANETLKKIQPVVNAACVAGVNVSVQDVQAFAQTVLPALGTIAISLPIKPAQLTQIEAGLTAAQIAVGTVSLIQSQVKAAQAIPAPAPVSAAAPKQ